MCRSGRHSSAGTHKRAFTPVPSPRLSRPASAPIGEEYPVVTAAENSTPPLPPPRPPLPSPSPVLHKARFASRNEINATYLTPPKWRNEHSSEYKRTASENLQAQLASQHLQSIEVSLPEAKRLSADDAPTATPEVAVPYSEEDSTSTASSDSSSLETLKPLKKMVASPGGVNVVDGSEDSAIGDTDGSPIVSQDSPKKPGGDSAMKPILRKPLEDGKENEGEEEGEEEEAATEAVESQVDTVDKEDPGSPKTGVRFHPLALLLDAALEGDLSLVKKAAEEVNNRGVCLLLFH